MDHKKYPRVSIVLPVYNGEKFLSCSIESCINQTFKDWELLIIDDCSDDSSSDIARRYQQKDERIYYYKNDSNMKLPRTLNRGFSLARGSYLTWTSDDNYYRPKAIEEMLNVLENSNADFVFTAFSTINENGETIKKNSISEDPRHLIWKYNIVGACFMYSRAVYEKIGDYDPDLFLSEDYDYWLRIFHEFEVEYIDEDLYAYRKHDRTLTAMYKAAQHEALEKVLLKNIARRRNLEKLDWFYVYRGLHRSRRMKRSLFERFEYLPKWCYYKIWDLFRYKR